VVARFLSHSRPVRNTAQSCEPVVDCVGNTCGANDSVECYRSLAREPDAIEIKREFITKHLYLHRQTQYYRFCDNNAHAGLVFKGSNDDHFVIHLTLRGNNNARPTFQIKISLLRQTYDHNAPLESLSSVWTLRTLVDSVAAATAKFPLHYRKVTSYTCEYYCDLLCFELKNPGVPVVAESAAIETDLQDIVKGHGLTVKFG